MPLPELLLGPSAGPSFSTLSRYTHALAASNVIHMPTPKFISLAGTCLPRSRLFRPVSDLTPLLVCLILRFSPSKLKFYCPEALTPPCGRMSFLGSPCSQPVCPATAPAAGRPDLALLALWPRPLLSWLQPAL